MARTAPHRRSAKVIPKLSPAADGNSIHNEILLALPRKECDAVFSDLELVEMRTHDQLNEMGEPIEYCYFVNSGLASILSVTGDGKSVEVGLTGKEGVVGLPLVVGLRTSATRVVVQVARYRISLECDKHGASAAQMLTTGKKIKSLFSRIRDAGYASCCLQSPSRSSGATGALAAHEPGPDWWR
jgi:hypothetical protein